MRRISELHEIHTISKTTFLIWVARLCAILKIVESLNASGRGSRKYQDFLDLELVNRAQRLQVQVLHVFTEAIKLTENALGSPCSSTAWMRGRIVIPAIQEWYTGDRAEKGA